MMRASGWYRVLLIITSHYLKGEKKKMKIHKGLIIFYSEIYFPSEIHFKRIHIVHVYKKMPCPCLSSSFIKTSFFILFYF